MATRTLLHFILKIYCVLFWS